MNEQNSKARRHKQPQIIISRGNWIVMTAIIISITALMVWMHFTTFTKTIETTAAVYDPKGIYILKSLGQAEITDIQVGQGRFVSKGQTLLLEKSDEQGGKINDQKITSPIDGKAERVFVAKGEPVDRNDPLYLLTNLQEGEDYDTFITLLGIEDLSNVSKGMEVHLYPAEYTDERYGYIKAVVDDVWSVGIERDELYDIMGADVICEWLGSSEYKYLVPVILKAQTKGGELVWSGGASNVMPVVYGESFYSKFIISKESVIGSIFKR